MNLFATKNWTTLFLVLFIVSAAAVSGQEEEEDAEEGEEAPPPTCKKVLFGLVQGFIRSALNCLSGGGKKLFALRSPFELATRFYCVVKCTLQEEGILDDTGNLDEVSALFYFQEKIPESIRDSVIGAAQPCLEMASGFNVKEYYCQSYAPFIQCVVQSFLTSISPYAIDCFATPGLGLFFSIIQFVVPRAPPASPAANEIRKRLAESEQTYRVRKGVSGNATATIPITRYRAVGYNNTRRYNNAGFRRQ